LTGVNVGTPNAAVLSVIDTASQYKNSTPILIGAPPVAGDNPDNPYPAPLVVSGQPSPIGSLRITLFNYSHTIPDNVDILVVGPTGQAFILMADAGGSIAIDPNDPVDVSLTDTGTGVLPDNGPIVTGNFEPTSWTSPVATFPPPAPAGPYNEPGSLPGGSGTQTLIGNFGGLNPNGTWNLFVRPDPGRMGNRIPRSDRFYRQHLRPYPDRRWAADPQRQGHHHRQHFS
jgi:hypothetical protein